MENDNKVKLACPHDCYRPGDCDGSCQHPEPAPAATDTGLVSNCDGKEQEAFETWAKSKRYDMHEHPMHYLFLDPKTNAAREGWNEAIRYCHSQAEELLAAAHDEKMFHVNDAVKAWNEVSRLETRVETLEADNAAQAARIEGLEKHCELLCDPTIIRLEKENSDLEAKLAAAEKRAELAEMSSSALLVKLKRTQHISRNRLLRLRNLRHKIIFALKDVEDCFNRNCYETARIKIRELIRREIKF